MKRVAVELACEVSGEASCDGVAIDFGQRECERPAIGELPANAKGFAHDGIGQ